jgi:dihydroceramidase
MPFFSSESPSEIGYWGQVDTTTSFCEPHYAVSPYFAEFYNAWSSLIFVVIGLWHLYTIQDRYLQGASLWLIVIGVGSFAFHATMRYYMQLLDEGPMMGFIATTFLTKTTVLPKTWWRNSATYLRVIMYSQCLMIIAWYLWTGIYEIFVTGFTLVVFQDCLLGLLVSLSSSSQQQSIKQKYFGLAVGFILVGKAVWEVERQTCPYYPHLAWPLHMVWHGLSAAAAHYGILANVWIRLECSQNKEFQQNGDSKQKAS